eukprot:11492226-Ditylum_brightwellii.AAC.1
MALSLNAAKLSTLSYFANEEPDGSRYGITLDNAHYYANGDLSDMAVVSKIDGYCYAAYRGLEIANLADWAQQLDPHIDKVCNDNEDCCDARRGIVRAYEASFKDQLEADLRDCVVSCEDNCTTVLTGHSQGGAIANIAAFTNAELNPYVITFGQPAAVYKSCPDIISERHYRYINSVLDGNELEHDIVPFSPNGGSSFFGYMIIISPQTDAVASYGLDAHPNIYDFHLNIEPWQAHIMDSGDEGYGYIQRIEALISHATSHNGYPINADGWKVGAACSDDGECISGFCVENKCK